MISLRFLKIVVFAILICFTATQANPVPAEDPPSTIWPAVIFATAAITVVGLIVYKFYKAKKDKRELSSENIRFEVDHEGGVMVRANYRLKGLSSKCGVGKVFYPLPNESDSLVQVNAGQKGVRANPVKSRMNPYYGYLLYPEPDQGNTAKLSVSYFQKPGLNHCRYILLTTKRWQRPVGRADFTIALPKGKKITRCTYAYKELNSNRNATEYAIACNDLWPDKDLEFSWK
jgi:hypothetical protein